MTNAKANAAPDGGGIDYPGDSQGGYTASQPVEYRSFGTWRRVVDPMRRRLAMVCNLLVPGSGLIVLRRDWLGLALGVLFGVFGQIALLGTLIVPATVPGWLTSGSLAAALVVWLWAQWQLWERLRVIGGSALKQELSALCRQAEQYSIDGYFAKAEDLLRLALSLDDEDLESNLHWAELMILLGKSHQARRAWHRVMQLDRNSQHRREAQQALAALPA